MSIDWIFDLERDIDNGQEVLACPGLSRNQWYIGKPYDELKQLAQRVANHKKMTVNIVRLVSHHDAIAGDLFLVPTKIGEPGARGEPHIEWSTVETKEAAEMMRDLRQGPAPFFAMQQQETVDPSDE
ncbi:MAG: hypothetical protein D6719_05365 [Candidatus Dadabacteria bacterium]|nr:MAG: hypothetical protein D6719_05365 [Candidatus Dadabacteria bacterium]